MKYLFCLLIPTVMLNSSCKKEQEVICTAKAPENIQIELPHIIDGKHELPNAVLGIAASNLRHRSAINDATYKISLLSSERLRFEMKFKKFSFDDTVSLTSATRYKCDGYMEVYLRRADSSASVSLLFCLNDNNEIVNFRQLRYNNRYSSKDSSFYIVCPVIPTGNGCSN